MVSISRPTYISAISFLLEHGEERFQDVAQGRILPLEKVRTTARAAQRLVELAAQAAGEGPVDVAVQHLAAAARAEEVAARLRERLDVARLLVSEVGAVIGAHVGTGLVGVVVVPRTGATPAQPS